MSRKPPKKSDMGKSWMKPRRDSRQMISPEYHLIVSEGAHDVRGTSVLSRPERSGDRKPNRSISRKSKRRLMPSTGIASIWISRVKATTR